MQDGTILASYLNPGMFVFLIEVPAEQNSTVYIGSICQIRLPNGRSVSGRIARTLAIADSLSQAERYIVRPNQPMVQPAHLQLNITFTSQRHNNAQSLFKAAVLSNERQTALWGAFAVSHRTGL